MKHSHSRQLFERARKAFRRFRQEPPRPTTAFDEMQRGSAIGLPASALIAAGMGSPESGILWAGLFGICVGALIGLLLWIGADDTHDDPVVPPGRGRRGRSDPRRGPPGP